MATTDRRSATSLLSMRWALPPLLAALALAQSGCIGAQPGDENVAATSQALDAYLYPVADTSVHSVSTGNANGASAYIFTGTDANLGASRRGLMQFDLSGFTNATITRAQVWFTVETVPAGASATTYPPPNDWISFYRVTQSWSEGGVNGGQSGGDCTLIGAGGATWAYRLCSFLSTTAWSSPGITSGAVSGYGYVANTVGLKVADSNSYGALLTDVNYWAANPSLNYGWAMRAYYEGMRTTARKISSRTGTNPPQLQLTFTCKAGYSWNGASCAAISNYCGAPLSVSNATLSALTGGVAGNGTYSMNTTASYTCNGGYSKTGANPVCQSTALWSAYPTCNVISNFCGAPPTVTNSGGASVSGGAGGGATNSVGATAAYTCNTGYAKSGSNATCQTTGLWSTAPTCVAVTNWCAAPPSVTNAGAPVVSGGVAGGATNSYLATAAYTCSTGYTKSGTNPQCQSNSAWGASPTCSPVNCGAAPSVANASVVVGGGAGGGSTTTYLATAAYTCGGGYTKSGVDATCQSTGLWSAAPTCVVVSNFCGAPASVTNASVVVSGGAAGGATNSVGATAAYTCSTGYSLSGSNAACQTNGAWSAAPSCVAVAVWCAAPPTNISNGSYVQGAGIGGYTTSLGATATYSCSGGYSLSGTNPSTCQAGQTWSTAPSCNAIAAFCPAVPAVTNASAGSPTGGAAGGSTRSVNATVTYGCNGGYSLSGTNPITCQSNATWTAGPTCSVISNFCGAPAAIANGSLVGVAGGAAGGATNSVGATATYACGTGYKFSGGGSSACQASGAWTAAPACIVDTAWCAAAPSVVNAGTPSLTGGLGGNGTTSYMATATYACNGGFVGGGTSGCQASRAWSASPTCSAVANYCGTPQAVANASSVAVSGGAAGTTTNSVGATAAYTCSPGYSLTGSNATCQSNGAWSTPPTCAPTANYCGATPVVANAAAATVSGGAAGGTTNSLGATAAYTCNTGYTYAGTDPTCQSNGSWSTAPTCTADVAWCSAAPVVTNAGAAVVSGGIAGGSTPSYNATASYSCNGGYAFAAGGSATCQASRAWSTSPVCNVISNYCGVVPTVANSASVTVSGGAAGGATLSVGATAAYVCNAGYSLSGSNATCSAAGTWTAAPTCVPIANLCGTASTVTNAGAPVVSGGAGGGATNSLGATAAYTCNVGYAKTGSNSTCQSNGTWTAAPSCNPVDCGTPPTITNSPAPVVGGGNGGGSTTTYGATAVYACNSGFTQSGANPTCLAGGSWSGTPSCVDVNECLSNPCGVGSCVNTVGAYTCNCPVGTYVFNNGTCEALNACNNGTSNCLPIADCTSSDPINFTCACPMPGYTGDGVTNCTDVDECASAPANNCNAANATCTNSVGSFSCGCAAGYVGDGITSCSAIANYCGSAPAVANAGVPAIAGGAGGGSTNSLAAVATYVCANGYGFVGGSTSICQADATWSAAPVCAPVASYCGAPPSVTHAAAPTVAGGIAGGSSSSMNAVAAYACDAGYAKSGVDASCQANGTWSAAPSCNPISNFCGAPPTIAAAGAPSVSGGAAGVGTYSLSATAAYTCNTGYSKSGVDSVCGAGATWSAPPTCTVITNYCPIAPSIAHAPTPTVSGGAAGSSTTSFGAVATYTCDAGYDYTAGSTSTCQANMSWSTLPTCAAIPTYCGAPPVVTHAAAPVVSGGAAGGTTSSLAAVAAYTCAAGYVKTGSDASCLANGSWSAAPACVPDASWCAAPPVVGDAGSPTIAGGLAGTTTTSLDAVASYVCSTGYAFLGGSSSTCQSDRSWSAAPTCAPISSFCGAPPVVADAGAPSISGGIGGGSSSSLSAIAVYACNGGYAPVGGSSSTCLPSGSWSAAPVCAPIPAYCAAPPVIANAAAPAVAGGVAGGASTSLAATASYVCDAGFDLSGVSSVCGVPGVWSAAPTCVPRDCGAAPVVANAGAASVSGGAGGGASTTYGATASYVCDSGFTLSGPDSTCLANATWSAAPACVDVDECATNNGGCGAPGLVTCVNNVGAAPTCVDIDECATSNGGCGNPTFTTCVNNDIAPPTCVDVDECATSNGGCGDPTYFACTNNLGGAPTCTDVDECATANGGCGPVSMVTCANNVGGPATCTDVDECATANGGCGSATFFACTNNVVAAPTCTDIDECATGNGGCGDPAYYTCANNVGGPATCADIDECASNNGDCGNPTYFTCANNVGAAPTCADIDECASNNGACGDPTYFTCANNVGAAPTCADIDECATNNGGCGSASAFTCTNVVGAPPTCADINECVPDPCAPGATCTDLVGSFTCACPAGYTGDGLTPCIDIDECMLGTHDCDAAATCSNTAGSFVCTCITPFYQGTGKQCADVDECLTNNGGCGPNATCSNLVGAPQVCVCNAGTSGDGGVGCAIVCGDGLRGIGERCDDGNLTSGDGCSDTCTVEPGYACYEPTNTVSTCARTCGNALIEPPAEECDDAANNSDTVVDACRLDCKRAHCGDSVVDTGESCDLGSGNSDTAPDTCRTDCRDAFCGDGVVDTARGERCDTGGGTVLADSVCANDRCPVVVPDGGLPDGGSGGAHGKGSCGCRVAESAGGAPNAAFIFVVALALAVFGRRARRSPARGLGRHAPRRRPSDSLGA